MNLILFVSDCSDLRHLFTVEKPAYISEKNELKDNNTAGKYGTLCICNIILRTVSKL